MTAILLGMTRLDPFNANPKSEPPDSEFAQVEQGVGGSEGDTVIAADAGGQATLFKSAYATVRSNIQDTCLAAWMRHTLLSIPCPASCHNAKPTSYR